MAAFVGDSTIFYDVRFNTLSSIFQVLLDISLLATLCLHSVGIAIDRCPLVIYLFIYLFVYLFS